MTGMLASVKNLSEAQLIAQTAVEIIDLKNPEQGALGALSVKTVSTIVKLLSPQKTISATVGDLPMQAALVLDAVNHMSESGVDYIKIGFFPEQQASDSWLNCLSALAPLPQQGKQLIAVLFADTDPDFQIIQAIADAGFIGVMLDTMDKSKGSLTQLMPFAKIEAFVQTAQKHKLICGLAGSLKQADIPKILPLTPNYLGFRGALCDKHNRTAQLDPQAIQTILRYFS